MDIYTQAENFVGLTEIKNVFNRIPSHEIPTCSGYLEINDQIVYNYERTLDQITRLKQSKYIKIKLERQLELEKTRKETTTNTDYYIGVENDIAMNITQSKLDIVNAVYDNTHTLKVEEVIKLNTKAYSGYIDTIQCFLKKIDYLYVDNKHILTREIIMTSEKYQQYLTKLFKEIIELSLFISNYRMNDEKIQNSMNNTKKEGRRVTNTKKIDINMDNYFEQHYEFTDNNIIRDKQQLLEKLIKVLFVLVKNIKNTYDFLNAIINTYWVKSKGDNFINIIVKKTTEYNIQRRMNQPLLPTSWIERMKFWFIQTKVNGKYKSTLEDYFRYISFWFEQNKIINDLRIYNVNINDQNTSNIDYVNFLFGNIITDKNEFIEEE